MVNEIEIATTQPRRQLSKSSHLGIKDKKLWIRLEHWQ
jgi:hypothetical protein